VLAFSKDSDLQLNVSAKVLLAEPSALHHYAG
jgi:hypothetical protein